MLAPVWRKTSAVRAAAQCYSTGDFAGTLRHMDRAVLADGDDAATAAELAGLLAVRARQQSGEPMRKSLDDALDYARLAVERNPARASYREARLRLEACRMDRSLLRGAWRGPSSDPAALLRELAAAAALRPRDADRLNRAAEAAYHAGDLSAAEQYLGRALDVVGDNWPILWDHLGNVYWLDGRPEMARASWRKLLARRAADGRVWADLIDPAVARLAGMDAQNSRLRLRLAELCWQTGRTEMMRRQLAGAVAADAALTPQSVMRFTEGDKARTELLKAKAAATDSEAAPGGLQHNMREGT
jgi:tetratricopeptide (TPR) repeat protein